MASIPRPAAPFPRPGPRHPVRWIAIGVASLLLHLAILDLLPDRMPADEPADDLPLRVTLMPPIVPATTEPPPQPLPRPAAPDRPRAKPRPRTPLIGEPDFVPQTLDPVPEVEAVTRALPATARDEARAPTATPAAPVTAEPVPPPAAPTAPALAPLPPLPPPLPAAIAPRSARLFYKVVYVDAKRVEPLHYYGVGTIDWTLADGRYASDLVASYDALLFKINLLASHSEGSVTTTGLAPDRYTESPRKRATVATNFNRDGRQTISFSASAATAPLPSGAQDRLSVLFQIGALLLADAHQATPSNRLAIPVAGVRGDVEAWVFEVQGPETIEAGGDPVATTHLRRAARPDSSDRTIDVWIAGQAGGYPARVLYTEANGSTVEMTLDRIGRID